MDPGQLTIVENALQQLIKEWERFFAGVRRTPPVGERERLTRRLRVLTEEGAGRHAEQFRLEQLQGRFQSFSMMWERMLREREEGRTFQGYLARDVSPPEPPSSTTRPSKEAPARLNAGAAAAVDDGGVGALYERYVAARRELGQGSRVDRETFAAQLEAQRRQLEGRLGSPIQFEVVVDGSKVKLAARRAGRPRQE